MKRTMRSVEESNAKRSETLKGKSRTVDNAVERKRKNAERIAPFRFKKGQSGNPGGRPKNDVAKAICQAAFENNPELIYRGLVKQLKRGAGYVFQVASDRAYGKITDKLQLGGGELVEKLLAGRKRAVEARAPQNRPQLTAPQPEVIVSHRESASEPVEQALEDGEITQREPAEAPRARARGIY